MPRGCSSGSEARKGRSSWRQHVVVATVELGKRFGANIVVMLLKKAGTGQCLVFTLPRCPPRWVPGRKSGAFIYCRQRYGPDPVWACFNAVPIIPTIKKYFTWLELGKNWSRSVMLRFAPVHSRCRPGNTTAFPGKPRSAQDIRLLWFLKLFKHIFLNV